MRGPHALEERRRVRLGLELNILNPNLSRAHEQAHAHQHLTRPRRHFMPRFYLNLNKSYAA